MLELIGIALTHLSQKDYIIRIAERVSREVQGYSYYGAAPLTFLPHSGIGGRD